MVEYCNGCSIIGCSIIMRSRKYFMNIMKNISKTPKQLERYFKGAANHRRIAILIAVSENEDITVEGISRKMDVNFKTISQHTRSLVHAGLLNKNYTGRQVAHSLSPYGKSFLKFMKTF